MYLQPLPIKYSLQPHLLLRVRCLHAPCVVQPRVSYARAHTHKRLCTQTTFDMVTPTRRNAHTKTNCSYGSPSKYFTHDFTTRYLFLFKLSTVRKQQKKKSTLENNTGARKYAHIPGCWQRGTDTLNGNGLRAKGGQQGRERKEGRWGWTIKGGD